MGKSPTEEVSSSGESEAEDIKIDLDENEIVMLKTLSNKLGISLNELITLLLKKYEDYKKR